MAKKVTLDMDIANIPASEFEQVNSNDYAHDAKFETKPIGYFKDAFIRFRKNKASIFASIVILLLVIFAVVVPMAANNRVKNTLDTYYSKSGPRVVELYNLGFDGGVEKTKTTEEKLISYYAIGLAATYDRETGKHASYEDAMFNNPYQPVIKLRGSQMTNLGGYTAMTYNVRIDSYLAVGFVNVTLTKAEVAKIEAFEKESGLNVFYPLLDLSAPYFKNIGLGQTQGYIDTEMKGSSNYWYMLSMEQRTKGLPVNSQGNSFNWFEGDMDFVPNYKKDASGNVLFHENSGGGDNETAGLRCRILYYNYYRYLHNGEAPNYVFGTDSQGYDLAYRMATGMRLSFLLSICVCIINFTIGAIYGSIEGYYGGTIDLVLERVSDILSQVPFVVVATLFQLHIAKKVGAIPSLLFAFVMTGWIGTAARVRSQFYRFKNQEYVLAARTLGASDKRIIWKHIFPNTLGTIITSSVLAIPGVIFTESMLSYLGIVNLGSATSTSLGTLLSEASGIWFNIPHLMIFPAVVISLLMICFNLFGNGLRDAFNPTLRGADE